MLSVRIYITHTHTQIYASVCTRVFICDAYGYYGLRGCGIFLLTYINNMGYWAWAFSYSISSSTRSVSIYKTYSSSVQQGNAQQKRTHNHFNRWVEIRGRENKCFYDTIWSYKILFYFGFFLVALVKYMLFLISSICTLFGMWVAENSKLVYRQRRGMLFFIR